MPKKDQRQYAAASPEERRGVVVTVEERRARTEVIERLLIAGVSMTRIEDTCKERFSMSAGKVRQYIEQVRARWAEEERQQRPHNKAAAIRRVLGHIAKAASDKNWAAVAQLEKHLADLQGTKEALEVHLNIDATVTEAALHVVANLTPERRAALIGEQRRLRELAARAAPGQASIEAEGVAVESDSVSTESSA